MPLTPSLRAPAVRTALAGLGATAALVGTVLTGPAHAAGPELTLSGATPVAPGVTYRTFTFDGSAGTSVGYELRADLQVPGVRVGLLHPPTIARDETVSTMARDQQAVGGTNGDFFNISDEHAGVPATLSSDGVEIARGRGLKGAVPKGQRFGPGLVPGTSSDSVFGVGVDHRARLDAVTVAGRVRVGSTRLRLNGLNQYALPVNGIGEYDARWGTGSLVRPTCGTDTKRSAPCSSDVAEVVIRHGRIVQVNHSITSTTVPEGATVLIGREQGADALAGLPVGRRVGVHYRLQAQDRPRFAFAVGAEPIMRDGSALPGVDTTAIAPRTGVGIGDGGHQVDLIVIDGRSSASAGVSIAEMTDILGDLGDTAGANLDGGGSSEMVARDAAGAVTVRNVPSDGQERPVANGVGIFAGRP